MYESRAAALAVSLLLSGAAAPVFAQAASSSRPPSPAAVLGGPVAEVVEEAWDGPPVVGDYLTLAPALAPLPPGNRTHDVRIDVVARELEIAPGVRYKAWTFGGTVPGPVLHVREGDRVRFTMKNRSAELVAIDEPAPDSSPFLRQVVEKSLQKGAPVAVPMPHGMDFHAGMVAPNDKWRPIQPGETIRFEWAANYPGVYLYHCSQAPVLQHVAMGQYGVVVVSPREGYPSDAEVDHEFVILQSEFYLVENEEGGWVLDFAAAMAKRPSQVTFNGHTRAMIDAPLEASPGERVRLYVHNVGPNDTSSFHVIGTILDRVYYEGNPLNELRGMQTVLLGASNGAVVEFVVPEEGDYPFVDHEFADATRGAIGRIKVGRPRVGPDQEAH